MFPHRNIRKYSGTVSLPMGRLQLDWSHIDMQEMAFNCTGCTISQGADCDTDFCVVVANVREWLAVSKQAAQKFDG